MVDKKEKTYNEFAKGINVQKAKLKKTYQVHRGLHLYSE